MRRLGFVVVLALAVSVPTAADGWNQKGSWWSDLVAWWEGALTSIAGIDRVVAAESFNLNPDVPANATTVDAQAADTDATVGMDPNGR